jgi:hypothetical protein
VDFQPILADNGIQSIKIAIPKHLSGLNLQKFMPVK